MTVQELRDALKYQPADATVWFADLDNSTVWHSVDNYIVDVGDEGELVVVLSASQAMLSAPDDVPIATRTTSRIPRRCEHDADRRRENQMRRSNAEIRRVSKDLKDKAQQSFIAQ